MSKALVQNIKGILLTPGRDRSYGTRDGSWQALVQHAEQLREMAGE
ncbi:hypothetical protein MKZ24_29400 [Paenibacillus sp. FSL R7-0297]|nr:hypothetical protein [Paenibacillus sp. FSL R5-0912]